MRPGSVALAATCALLAGACQEDVATPFPPGLEPLEDSRVPAWGPTEEVRVQSTNTDYIRVHGRGFVFSAPARVWELTKQPTAMYARCDTDKQQVTPDNDPGYESSFLVHYTVYDVLTVEWDDQWRYGVVEGTIEAPTLAMIRHQKTQGSDFISLSTGTIQLLATDDPQITELVMVEHLDAVGGTTSDVENGMRDQYARLRALAHAQPAPSCP